MDRGSRIADRPAARRFDRHQGGEPGGDLACHGRKGPWIMPRRILIIIAHPDPAPERFCRALAAAYGEGAEAAGHKVQILDLATLDIPLLRTQTDFLHEPVPDSLRPALDAIVQAEHLVLLFPLWLGTMPALLKAFLEQTLRPGTAFFHSGKAGFPIAGLGGRTGRIVVTMGMPASLYRLWFRDHGIACLRRNILNFVGIQPVRETLFGMVDAASDHQRDAWLERMRRLGRRAS